MANQRAGEKLGITWTDETVNPLSGCNAVSEGCLNCWAADTSHGLLVKGHPRHDGLTILNQRGHHEWTGNLSWKPEELQAFSRGQPRRIFINSMSDTFHAKVKTEWLDEMFERMRQNPQHEYQILTKRPAGMLKYLRDRGVKPQQNMLMGFSAENQRWFDERWKYAKQVADLGWRVWTSIEPQVGAITLGAAAHGLSWVVIGGDNTIPHSHAREFDIAWATALIAECQAASVPVFMKQLGVAPYWTINGLAYAYPNSTGEGKYLVEWPESIRIQEFPV